MNLFKIENIKCDAGNEEQRMFFCEAVLHAVIYVHCNAHGHVLREIHLHTKARSSSKTEAMRRAIEKLTNREEIDVQEDIHRPRCTCLLSSEPLRYDFRDLSPEWRHLFESVFSGAETMQDLINISRLLPNG